MIPLEEFLEIFEKTKISGDALVKFYKSIKQSLVLINAGRQTLPRLLKIENECQWPVLEKIGDPKLNIYKGADPVLLRMFINSIKDEKEIRLKDRKTSRGDDWIILRILIQTRTQLYENIFDFNKKDIERCKRAGRRLEKIIQEKRKEQKKLWMKMGTGAAAVGAIGATYIFLKNKKGNDK